MANNMELTVQDIMQGKPFRSNKRIFLSTEAYVKPFVDKMSKWTDDFRVSVKAPKFIPYNTKGEVQKDEMMYSRVLVQAVLPERTELENHKKVLGLLYALDTRKPVVKFYYGNINCACTNLSLFNPDNCIINEVHNVSAFNYDAVDYLMEKKEPGIQTLIKLKESTLHLSAFERHCLLGEWVENALTLQKKGDYGITKVSANDVVKAYDSIFISESPYYVGDGPTDFFNVYNAFTQVFTNDISKDIVSYPEKTLLLREILQLDKHML